MVETELTHIFEELNMFAVTPHTSFLKYCLKTKA